MSRLLSIIGTPSPLSHATLGVIRNLTNLLFRDHLIVHANSATELRNGFPSQSARGEKSVILFSDYPQPDLITILLAANAPLVICADDFPTIAYFAVISRGFGGVDAARHATMSLVNIERVVSAPPQLSVLVNDPKISLAELITRLAELFSLELDTAHMPELLASLECADVSTPLLRDYAAKIVPVPGDARDILERRSPLENELIGFLAREYDGIVHGQRLTKLQWPVYALLQPDFPDRLTVGPIDLTGPARFIYFGPYFALPTGAWNASIAIEVADCYSDNLIAIDVNAHTVLSTVTAKLPERDAYGCQIRFQIDDPTHRIEIRVRTPDRGDRRCPPDAQH